MEKGKNGKKPSVSERILSLEHAIMGNGSIGLKEQVTMLRQDLNDVRRDYLHKLDKINRVIWFASGGLAVLMLIIKYM